MKKDLLLNNIKLLKYGIKWPRLTNFLAILRIIIQFIIKITKKWFSKQIIKRNFQRASEYIPILKEQIINLVTYKKFQAQILLEKKVKKGEKVSFMIWKIMLKKFKIAVLFQLWEIIYRALL